MFDHCQLKCEVSSVLDAIPLKEIAMTDVIKGRTYQLSMSWSLFFSPTIPRVSGKRHIKQNVVLHLCFWLTRCIFVTFIWTDILWESPARRLHPSLCFYTEQPLGQMLRSQPSPRYTWFGVWRWSGPRWWSGPCTESTPGRPAARRCPSLAVHIIH